MARQYPRFLFSNPTNTKSEGPFLIHCIYPKCVMKILDFGTQLNLQFIEFWEEPLQKDDTGLKETVQRKMLNEAKQWLISAKENNIEVIAWLQEIKNKNQ